MPDRYNVQDLLDEDVAAPPKLRSAPISLVLYDLWLVITRVLPQPYNLFFPLARKGLFNDITLSGALFQIILGIWAFLLFIPLLLLGVIGGLTPILAAYASAWPFLWVQGGPIITIPARMSTLRDPMRRRNARESWVFINGICTSKSGVQLILKRLEHLFQRPVTAIRNATLGIFGDLLFCVIQRDALYATESIRVGYVEIRRRLQDAEIEKVVVLCHSQGGIIASLIIDQLLVDLPREQIGKLEVYTFGNAANHFSNPLLKSTLGEALRSIPHIEHYANGLDPVADIGVLAFQPTERSIASQPLPKPSSSPPATTAAGLRFRGRLFVRWQVSGHLLLSHYLGVDSILDTAEARRFSRLRRYLGGASPSD